MRYLRNALLGQKIRTKSKRAVFRGVQRKTRGKPRSTLHSTGGSHLRIPGTGPLGTARPNISFPSFKTGRNSRLLGFPRPVWYTVSEVMIPMKTSDIILELRTRNGLSQDALAEKVFVTRQAVSRWETGETIPNTETLKLLSKLFDVSINTLLGSPRKLVCQCCGMPLDDSSISRETDGSFNEEYCKWCYADGKFLYSSLQELTNFLVGHMANENWPEEQVRSYLEAQLPELNYWRQMKK